MSSGLVKNTLAAVQNPITIAAQNPTTIAAQNPTCTTVTRASAIPTTPVALQSYSYCGGTLDITAYIQVSAT